MAEMNTTGISLVSGLGGNAGFGENLLSANDDGSTEQIDLSSIFENGINFFGTLYDGLWVNNNGSVTFNGPRSTYTPDVITGVSGNPEITAFFGDVDTRGGMVAPTPGGNSTGSNLVYYDFNEVTDQFIVTWDDVGFFSSRTDLLNAFQLILTDQGGGDFDIEFRYEDINWTTGNASGGVDGLGGSVARAGYTAGSGVDGTFFELPASGDQGAILDLDSTLGNTDRIGRWEFQVRNGGVVESVVPLLPQVGAGGWTTGDPHLSTLDGVNYDFQAVGEFVLLQSANGGDFAIQARMLSIGDNVSVNAAVATNLGGGSVMIDGTDATPFSINGVATVIEDFSFVQVGDDRVYREGDTYIVVYAGADNQVGDGDSQMIVTVFDGRVDIDIRLNDALLGTLEGLLGDGDGDATNDVALANGTVLARPFTFDDLYGQYRDDWRVTTAADSLFTYDAGESLDGFYQEDHPSVLVSLDDLDAATRDAAEQAAQNAGLVPGTTSFENAVLDFALTNDTSFLESALNTPANPNEAITGTDEADRLFGTVDADRIIALGGDDTVVGNDGADELFGQQGNDWLIGGTVEDVSSESGAQVYRTYHATLGRAPDTMGFDNWTDRLDSGAMQLSEVVTGFVRSPEFQNTYGNLDNAAFVTLLYDNVLDRDPDATGLTNWTASLDGGMAREQVVIGFSESAEFRINTSAEAYAYVESAEMASAWADDVYRLYQATLDREPDITGLENWSGRLGSGMEFRSVVSGFVNSQEFQNTYGALGNSEFVTLLYNNVLDRAPDATGLTNWTARLDTSEMSREQVVEGFSQSPEFIRNTAPGFDTYISATEGDTFRGGTGNDFLYGGMLADEFDFDVADTGNDRVLQLDVWDTLSFTGFGYADASEVLSQMQQVGEDVIFFDQDVSITFMRTDVGVFGEIDILV